MAFVLADRVKETSTTTGTGTLTLSGSAPTGYQLFGDALSNLDVTYYLITDDTDWEAGIGTWTLSGNTLSRDTIFASSNGGSAVNWAAGTRNVFITLPGEAVSSLLDTLTNGILAQTTARTYARRSIAVSGPGISIANANGVSGDPTITIAVIPSSNASMLFKESSAPSGWTQDATVTFDEVLRLVGTGGTGDGTGGSADVAGGTVAAGIASSLSEAQLGSHDHRLDVAGGGPFTGHDRPTSTAPPADTASFGGFSAVGTKNTANAGSGSTHNHGNVTYNIKYRNIIVCDKDAPAGGSPSVNEIALDSTNEISLNSTNEIKLEGE